MGKVFNGINANTAKNMQLDAGIIIVKKESIKIQGDINIDTLKSDEGCIGATKGGTTFTATPEIRDALDGVDGVRGAYKETQIIDTWDGVLKTTITEMTAKNIENLIFGSETTPANHKKRRSIVGKIPTANYLNVYWLGAIAGDDKPMIIHLKNAININGFNFTAEDKGSGSVEVEFRAHYDVAKPNEVPFTIYLPDQSQLPSRIKFKETKIEELDK